MIKMLKTAAHGAARLYIRYFHFRLGKDSLWKFTSWRIFDFSTKTKFGVRMVGNTQDLIQRYIYYFGVWEPHISAFISSRLRLGDCFIDIGSNIGYYSLLTSRLVGQNGKVVAIEASPKIFDMLQNHISINKAVNIRAINKAVSNARSRVVVHHGKGSNIGSTSLLKSFDDTSIPDAEVDAAPLGELLLSDEIAKARLIKIDVEGAEWLVIEGMHSVFQKLRENVEILMEVDSDQLEQFGKTFDDVLNELKKYGFNAYVIRNKYKPDDYLYSASVSRPERLEGVVEHVVDIVFSRVDKKFL